MVSINVYDKNHTKISIGCEINFPAIKVATTEYTYVDEIPVCYYTHANDTSAVWSTEDRVTLHGGIRDYDDYLVIDVTCKCTNLTSCIILMEPQPINEVDSLGLLTDIEQAISIVSLIITLIIICGIKDLRNSDRYRTLRHLVIALLCFNVLFMFLDVDLKHTPIACNLVAACLHYSSLVAFSWMLIMSTDVYMKINHPFADHEKRFSYSRYIGWIGPVIVVGLTAGITRENYTSHAECRLGSGATWSSDTPICITVLIVLVQLVVTGCTAFKKSKLPNQTAEEMQTLKRIRTLLCGLLLLTPAVGLTWIIGIIVLFDHSDVVEYIFVILNTMQGFFILLSQCVFSKEVREALKKTFSNRIRSTINSSP